MNKIKVYCASGWFTSRMARILDSLEATLTDCEFVSLYSPRRDGIMLPPNQKHDTKLRESIFAENLKNIENADVVVANIDCGDSYNDPGTVYEVGYAMSKNIPVVGFALPDHGIDKFGSILSGFDYIVFDTERLLEVLSTYLYVEKSRSTQKVLFVGADNEDVNEKIAATIIESDLNLRWINELSHPNIYSRVDEIFEGVDYMIAVIDDRKSTVSWMMGQAYARGIPIVTYSDFNYGVNIMLLCSLVTHLRGESELKSFLQKVKREGLGSIPPFDISTMNAM